MKAIGLMSGTSLDGIDAAAVHVTKIGERYHARLDRFVCLEWPADLRARLLLACEDKATTSEIARLDTEVGRAFARATRQVLEKANWRAQDVDVIGSHGQTVFHAGDEGITLQIGDPATIAIETGILSVGNFRRHDVALGGQGAPLTPWADWHLYSSQDTHRIVHNIGGMANLSWLARNGSKEQVRAWDTGPGNAILDACADFASQGRERCDWNGERAARGRTDLAWLDDWKSHPFFAKSPPKSCGREEFGRGWAAQFYDEALQHGLSGDDILCNATRLVAWSMARGYAQVLGSLEEAPQSPEVLGERVEIVACGGGAHNPTLLRLLREEIQEQIGAAWLVRRLEEIGGEAGPSEAREAVAFAMMACAAVEGEKNTLPSVTGASRACVAGQAARP